MSVELVFAEEPHEANARLLRFLGVTWRIDPAAPKRCEHEGSIYDFPLHPTRERDSIDLSPAKEPPMEVSAQTLTETVFCRWPGCEQEAVTKAPRGPYSRLCADHLEIVKREQRLARGRDPEGPTRERTAAAPDSFEAKAKALVPVGKTLDQAVSKFKRKQAEIEPAQEELRIAMAKWRAALNALAGSDSDQAL